VITPRFGPDPRGDEAGLAHPAQPLYEWRESTLGLLLFSGTARLDGTVRVEPGGRQDVHKYIAGCVKRLLEADFRPMRILGNRPLFAWWFVRRKYRSMRSKVQCADVCAQTIFPPTMVVST